MAVTRVAGILRGMGREVPCELMVWRETSSTGRVYTRCRVVSEPSDLPDGSYNLFFAGHYKVSTRKWEGHWLLRYLPPGIRVEEAA